MSIPGVKSQNGTLGTISQQNNQSIFAYIYKTTNLQYRNYLRKLAISPRYHVCYRYLLVRYSHSSRIHHFRRKKPDLVTLKCTHHSNDKCLVDSILCCSAQPAIQSFVNLCLSSIYKR